MRGLATLTAPIGESTVCELHRRIVARSQPAIAGFYGSRRGSASCRLCTSRSDRKPAEPKTTWLSSVASFAGFVVSLFMAQSSSARERRFGWLNTTEIMSPSDSNHFRYGTSNPFVEGALSGNPRLRHHTRASAMPCSTAAEKLLLLKLIR